LKHYFTARGVLVPVQVAAQAGAARTLRPMSPLMSGTLPEETAAAAQVRTLFFIHGHWPFHTLLALFANDSQIVELARRGL
jgi:hypothetical protein